MPVRLHLAPTTDQLADGLATLLAAPAADPFAEEVVAVPARGVERWLTQRLSHRLGAGGRGHDGVCAGVRFLNPRSLVALLAGTEHDDPWDPDRLVWPLLEVVDASLDEPWCSTLAAHLGHGCADEQAELRQDRRYAVVRRLAGLYASYATQRPAVLRAWREGRDEDGAGQRLPGDLLWQAELWRRLLDVTGAVPPEVRHEQVLADLRGGAALPLPDRLSLFGHTRLPATELELLAALGETREVHLWLPQPSPAAWRTLAPLSSEGIVRRHQDSSRTRLSHPLLASLGRDARELQRSLSLLGGVEVEELPVPGGVGAVAATRLTRLQQELRADAPPSPDRAQSAASGGAGVDRSVQVHACHGATRQVEVLREVLVGLMEDDPTLEPRDILVMCPDVEAWAPLFAAAFGLTDEGFSVTGGTSGSRSTPQAAVHPAHRLRVRLADRGLMSTNPLLAMAGTLVTLAGGRATASEVLDLAATEPVRHRFGWNDDDLATVLGWVRGSGVRWGLDGGLRAAYRLADFPQNTWQAGLDRILLGVAMAEEEGCHLGAALPLDDVGSSAVDLAGALAEMVARLEVGVRRLQAATTLRDWLTALRETVLSLGSVPARDAWQVAQFERELDTLLEQGSGGASGRGADLRLADVRHLLEQRLRPRPTRANFRTGNLTVSTLVPMRSVPHRVICLVGLDDGVFPRSPLVDGDDVLARDPLTGERDPRSEDRQLLLDAVLAAGDTLVVTYAGADEVSGQPKPPAVPLGELLDALEAAEPGARKAILVHHPLQPFDARNFEAGALGSAEPFSFDAAGLAGAQAARGTRTIPANAYAAALPAVAGDLTLADLQSFLSHPVRGYLRQRLDVAVPAEYDEIDDALPIELDALERWGIGDRVLRRALAGADPMEVFLAEQYRGSLPPLRLGEQELRAIVERVQALYRATLATRSVEPTSKDVTVDLGGAAGGGRRLTGVVPDLRGHRIVRVHYSTLGPKHRLAAWVDLLALSAAFPDQAWTASVYGWHRTGPRHALIGPVDHTALDRLRDLVDLRDRGLREPLPLPLKTGHAYADAIRAHRDADRAARGEWETQDRSPVPGEVEDAAHCRVFGRGVPLDCLQGQPRPDEQWNDEAGRLGRYSLRLWAPLFEHERVMSA